jgi:hypothetical protein
MLPAALQSEILREAAFIATISELYIQTGRKLSSGNFLSFILINLPVPLSETKAT